jgi:hypothetical protein
MSDKYHPSIMEAIDKLALTVMSLGFEPDFSIEVSPTIYIHLLEESLPFQYNVDKPFFGKEMVVRGITVKMREEQKP